MEQKEQAKLKQKERCNTGDMKRKERKTDEAQRRKWMGSSKKEKNGTRNVNQVRQRNGNKKVRA